MIRAKPAMVLHAIGTETRGLATHTTEVDAWTDIDSSTPSARLKVTSFVDGKFRYGWAADGVQLFHYDPLQNEYSASMYGAYSGRQPDRLADTMLQSVVALSKGAAIMPIRFLRDIYSGDGLVFKSWMAGVIPVEISTDVVHTVTYEAKTRKLVYTLNPKSGALETVEYWDISGNGALSSHWTLTYSILDSAPKEWDFSFKPPEGCRPVPLIHG